MCTSLKFPTLQSPLFERPTFPLPILLDISESIGTSSSVASRKKRIAAGAGVEVHEVNKLLKSYEQMSTMMKQMGKLGGMSKLLGSPLLKNSPFGGMGGKFPF